MAYNKSQKLNDNIRAIEIAFSLLEEGRSANAEERVMLSRYSGFGGLKFILNPCANDEDRKSWSSSDISHFEDTRKLFSVIRQHCYGDDEKYRDYVQSVKRSVNTAFYTPKSIVTAISDVLKSQQITVNTMLDPSSGAGCFIDSFKEGRPSMKVKAYEKDLLTGLILQALHSEADVTVDGFETMPVDENGKYDLVTSNIPFGNISVFDGSFSVGKEKVRRSSLGTIHNYFFIKALDAVREGGLVAFITSQGVMDSSLNTKYRQYMMEHADLVSAVRLPDGMFRDEAGTEVGSDLIVLQKHSGKNTMTALEKSFVKSEKVALSDGSLLSLNSYLIRKNNSESRKHILADTIMEGKNMYGNLTYRYFYDGNNGTLSGMLLDLLKSDFSVHFSKELYEPHVVDAKKTRSASSKSKNRENSSTPVQLDFFSLLEEVEEIEAKKPSDYTGVLKDFWRDGTIVKDRDMIGTLRLSHGGVAQFHPMELDEASQEAMSDYIEVRDFYYELYNMESTTHVEQESLRRDLNAAYDRFVERHGYLNNGKNSDFIQMDTLGKSMLFIENSENGQFVKADIFLRPVAFSQEQDMQVMTPSDALSASLNRTGSVDLSYMASISDFTEEELRDSLKERIYLNPLVDGYEVADKFLAGNVVEKLENLRQWHDVDEVNEQELQRSITALEGVLPTPITYQELDFNFGERWMPKEYFTQFASEFFETDIKISYAPQMDEFVIDVSGYSAKLYTEYAIKGETKIYDGEELLRHALYNTVPDIKKCVGYKPNGDPIMGTDHEKVQLAASKIDEIRDAFTSWIDQHPEEWKKELADRYNRKFNCFVRASYDGSHQTFPGLDLKGLSAGKYKINEIYKSQKDCVWMLLQNGGGICDHEVGTGKTLTMCIAAHEMKRLGLAHKPIIIGMKANVGEIAATYQAAFPDDKILYASEKDFVPANRREFFNRIKNNDYACVIMSHDQFGKIPQSADIQQQVIQEEINAIDEALDVYERQGHSVSGRMRSGLEKRKINLQNQLLTLNASLARRYDEIVDFKTMGIDHIFIDESQAFKNLAFTTRDSRVAGLGDPKGSERARNLQYAIRTIQERTGRDLGATFLSGTTISNSLTELYLLFKYLRPQAMSAQDINSFDAWAAVFARKSRDYEFNVAGNVVMKERYRQFIKVPELGAFYNEVTDYKTAADVGLDRPNMDVQLVNIQPTEDQQDFQQRLLQFAESGDGDLVFRAPLSDSEEKAKMLIVTNLGKKCSLSPKLVNPDYHEGDNTKIGVAAKNISEMHYQFNEQKGTQFVFCDLSTPKKGEWSAYQELKDRLVNEYHIPEAEIQFIQDAGTEKKKKEFIDKMNRGDIRVMIGSTTMLGTGVNAQRRAVAVHHLDLPWRPSDMEQRNGRARRKGNEVARDFAGNTVKCFVYAVERSLDSYNFYLLQAKSEFIRQMKQGSLGKRSFDQGGEDADNGMPFAEYVAITSGNTDLLERAKLEKRILGLESERKAFYKQQQVVQQKLTFTREQIRHFDSVLEKLNTDKTILERALDGVFDDGVNVFDAIRHSNSAFDIQSGDDPQLARYTFDMTQNNHYGEYMQKIARREVNGEVTVAHLMLEDVDWPLVMSSKTEYNPSTGVNRWVGNKFAVVGTSGLHYTFNNGKVSLSDKNLAANYPFEALSRIPEVISDQERQRKSYVDQLPELERIANKVWGKADQLKDLKEQFQVLDRKILIDMDSKVQQAGQKAEELPYTIEQMSWGRNPWELKFAVKDYPYLNRIDRETVGEQFHGSVRVHDGIVTGKFRHQFGAESAIKELSKLNKEHKDDIEWLKAAVQETHDPACIPALHRLREMGYNRHGRPLEGVDASHLKVISLGAYQHEEVRALSHGVKENNPVAIEAAVGAMAKALQEMPEAKNAVLVSIPSHKGFGGPIQLLARELSEKTGIPYVDALNGAEHESLYEWKRNHPGEELPELFFSEDKNNPIPEGKIPVLIDNVIDTGHTAWAAVDALEAQPIMLTIGSTGKEQGSWRDIEIEVNPNGLDYINSSTPSGVGLTGMNSQKLSALLLKAQKQEDSGAKSILHHFGIDWYTGQPRYLVSHIVDKWNTAFSDELETVMTELFEKGSSVNIFTENQQKYLSDAEKAAFDSLISEVNERTKAGYSYQHLDAKRRLVIIYEYLKEKADFAVLKGEELGAKGVNLPEAPSKQNLSTITDEEWSHMITLVSDLQTGNHLLGRPRSDAYKQFFSEVARTHESVQSWTHDSEWTLTNRQKELLLAESTMYYKGLSDLADFLEMDVKELSNALDAVPVNEENREVDSVQEESNDIDIRFKAAFAAALPDDAERLKPSLVDDFMEVLHRAWYDNDLDARAAISKDYGLDWRFGVTNHTVEHVEEDFEGISDEAYLMTANNIVTQRVSGLFDYKERNTIKDPQFELLEWYFDKAPEEIKAKNVDFCRDFLLYTHILTNQYSFYPREDIQRMIVESQDKKVEESPIMKQFHNLKAKHPDALLLFRCGDFYETYEADAKEASRILGITLVYRNGHSYLDGDAYAMAGFPFHAIDMYLPKLIRAGKRVAICDQLEAPKQTAKRGITEEVNPGLRTQLVENMADVKAVLPHQAMLRDALVERMREARIKVNTNVAEGEYLLSQLMENTRMMAVDRTTDEYKQKSWVTGELSAEDAHKLDNIKLMNAGDRQAYGFVYNDEIYVDRNIATEETPLHEYTHLWAEVMRLQNPKEWENIVSLMKGNHELWHDVTERYSQLTDEDDIAEEVLAHYSGKRGFERMEEEYRNHPGLEKGNINSILDTLSDALSRLWSFVADFLHIHYTSKEQVADQILRDALNGVNPLDYRLADTEKVSNQIIRPHFIGEIGARNIGLSRGDGFMFMTRLLESAKDYEQRGYDALRIKQITGWERGADGKWRSELSGIRVKSMDVGTNTFLSDIIDAPDLFKAYPELKNVHVEIGDIFDNGQYNHDTNTITLNEIYRSSEVTKEQFNEVLTFNEQSISDVESALRDGKDVEFNKGLLDELHQLKESVTEQASSARSIEEIWPDVNSVIAHEVQHVIQHIEGFAVGGNLRSVANMRLESAQAEMDKYKDVYDEYKLLEDKSFYADDVSEVMYYIREMDKYEAEHGEELKAYLAARANRDAAEMDIVKGVLSEKNFDEYRRLAGEVEARNVSRRAEMSVMERRNSLAASTEDVERDRQIISFGSLGAASQASDIADLEKYSESRNPTQVEHHLTPADREAGGAIVDYLEKMGISVHTDLKEYRQAMKAAEKDNSQEGNVRYFTTESGNRYGFSYKGKMYLDLRKIDAELPLNQYAHLWCSTMQKVNPEGWNNIVETLKSDHDVWDFALHRNDGSVAEDSIVAEDIICRYSGRRGAEKLQEELQRMNLRDDNYSSRWSNIFKNISKVIQDSWKHIGDSLNIEYKSVDDIADMILKDFATKVNPVKKMENWLKERDKEYADAVASGDMDKAHRLFNSALQEHVGNGITPYVAVDGYRGRMDRLAREVKSPVASIQERAINEAADRMSPLISAYNADNAVLVPTPSHNGNATDMLSLANAISERTGIQVADVLKSEKRHSQYNAKKETGKALSSEQLGIRKEGELPEGKLPIVIDNVVNSGNTAKACVDALGGGIVLAVASAVTQSRHVSSLKSAEPILYDKNNNLVPLSERFEFKNKHLTSVQGMPSDKPIPYQEPDIVQGLEDYDLEDLHAYVENSVQEVLDIEYPDKDIYIKQVTIIGSRARGEGHDDSDLDILLEYGGKDVREDDLFNVLNSEDNKISLEGIEFDINPINAKRSLSTAAWLARDARWRENEKLKNNVKNTEIMEKKEQSQPMQTKSQELLQFFNDVKSRYSNEVIILRQKGFLESFGKDAELLAEKFDEPLQERVIDNEKVSFVIVPNDKYNAVVETVDLNLHVVSNPLPLETLEEIRPSLVTPVELREDQRQKNESGKESVNRTNKDSNETDVKESDGVPSRFRDQSSQSVENIIDDFVKRDERFRYQMLGRMKSDVDYYLGAANHHDGVLWAGNPRDHISIMDALMRSLPEQPEWLTKEQFADYASKMLEPEKDFQKKVAAAKTEVQVLIDTYGLDYTPIVLPQRVFVLDADNPSREVSYGNVAVKGSDVVLYEDIVDSYDDKNGVSLSELPQDKQLNVLEQLRDKLSDESRDLSVYVKTELVPEYALSAIINGDFSGIEDAEDKENIEDFLDRYAGMEFCVREDQPSFTNNPAFGKPIDCVPVDILEIITTGSLRVRQIQKPDDIFRQSCAVRERQILDLLGNRGGIDFIQRYGSPYKVVNDASSGGLAYINEIFTRNGKVIIDGAIGKDGSPVSVNDLSDLKLEGIDNLLAEVREVVNWKPSLNLTMDQALMVADHHGLHTKVEKDLMRGMEPELALQKHHIMPTAEKLAEIERLNDPDQVPVVDAVPMLLEKIIPNEGDELVLDYDDQHLDFQYISFGYQLFEDVKSIKNIGNGYVASNGEQSIDVSRLASGPDGDFLLTVIKNNVKQMEDKAMSEEKKQEEVAQQQEVEKQQEKSEQQVQAGEKKMGLNIDYTKYALPKGMTVERPQVFKFTKGNLAGRYAVGATINGTRKVSVLKKNDLDAFFNKDKSQRCTVDQLAAKYFGVSADSLSLGSVTEAEHVKAEQDQEKVDVAIEDELQKAEDLKKEEERKEEVAEQEKKKEKEPSYMVHSALLAAALVSATEKDGVWLNDKMKSKPGFIDRTGVISGYSLLLMGLHSDANGYKTNEYTTFKGARQGGYSVMKGETGLPVNWYSWDKYINKYNSKDIIDKEKFESIAPEERDLYKQMRSKVEHTVFNANQTTMPVHAKSDYKEILQKQDYSIAHKVSTEAIEGDPSVKEYMTAMREREPETMLMFKSDEDFYSFYKEDALEAGKILKQEPVHKVVFEGENQIPVVKVAKDNLKPALTKLLGEDKKIQVIDQTSKGMTATVFSAAEMVNKPIDELVNNLAASDKEHVVLDFQAPTGYDREKDLLTLNVSKEETPGEQFTSSVSRAADIYRSVVAYTNNENRLYRSNIGYMLPKDSNKYDCLVQELTSGVLMLRQGLPAKISEQNMPLIPYWERELKENPKIVERLETDVNNALKVISELGKGNQVDYQSMRGEKSVDYMSPKYYSILSKLEKIPSAETRNAVIIRDRNAKSAAVILPAGASTEFNNEIPGMNKNRYVVALRKEGFENVNFYNAGGALGLNKSNDFFEGKEVEVGKLKQYELLTVEKLDLSKEIADTKKPIIDKISFIKDDNNRFQLFISPSKEFGKEFTIYPENRDLTKFFDLMKTQKEESKKFLDVLGQKYYSFAQIHPEMKTDLLHLDTKGVDLSRITNANLQKDKFNAGKYVMFATIDGEKQKPVQVDNLYVQRAFLVSNPEEYKTSLAAILFADKLNISEGQDQGRFQGNDTQPSKDTDVSDRVEKTESTEVTKEKSETPQEEVRRGGRHI